MSRTSKLIRPTSSRLWRESYIAVSYSGLSHRAPSATFPRWCRRSGSAQTKHARIHIRAGHGTLRASAWTCAAMRSIGVLHAGCQTGATRQPSDGLRVDIMAATRKGWRSRPCPGGGGVCSRQSLGAGRSCFRSTAWPSPLSIPRSGLPGSSAVCSLPAGPQSRRPGVSTPNSPVTAWRPFFRSPGPGGQGHDNGLFPAPPQLASVALADSTAPKLQGGDPWHIVEPGFTSMDIMRAFRDEGRVAGRREEWYEDKGGGSAFPVLYRE